MEIKVFSTLPDDAAEIRKAVFMAEQGFKDEFDEFEENATHFVGYINGAAVGTCRVHFAPEYSAHKIGRIAVVKNMRGQGLGETMVREAEKWLKEKSVSGAVILAQVQAAGFYEKLGYSKTDVTTMEEHCPHILMTKTF